MKWAIMGTGRIAHTFAQALCEMSDAELYAVASRSEEKSKEFGQKYSAKVCYSSYEDMAKDKDIDIVYIATPMSCHFENCLLCIENGRNVLLEKAVTMNSAEFEILIKKAEDKGVFLMEAMWMKCRPAFLAAKRWWTSGAIGAVKMVKADFMNTVVHDYEDRLFNKSLGGGCILDLGVYTITFACEFLGYNPTEIVSNIVRGRDGVDLDASIVMKYADGGFAAMTVGFDAPCHNNAAVIGTKARIEMGDWFFCTGTARLAAFDGRVIEKIDIPNEINGYEYEIREAQGCLERGARESDLVPLKQTLAVMKIIDKCLEN